MLDYCVTPNGKPHCLDPKNVRLWAFGVSHSLNFVLGLSPIGGFWKWSKWPWNMIHLMLCRNPCRLYIYLAFIYSVGPSSVVWNQLGPAPPFSTNESAWSAMVTVSQSRVWSGPISWSEVFKVLFYFCMQVYISTNMEIQYSWLSLKDEWFKFKTLDKLPIILERSIEYTLYA